MRKNYEKSNLDLTASDFRGPNEKARKSLYGIVLSATYTYFNLLINISSFTMSLIYFNYQLFSSPALMWAYLGLLLLRGVSIFVSNLYAIFRLHQNYKRTEVLVLNSD